MLAITGHNSGPVHGESAGGVPDVSPPPRGPRRAEEQPRGAENSGGGVEETHRRANQVSFTSALV